jgi:hypothetical protein
LVHRQWSDSYPIHAKIEYMKNTVIGTTQLLLSGARYQIGSRVRVAILDAHILDAQRRSSSPIDIASSSYPSPLKYTHVPHCSLPIHTHVASTPTPTLSASHGSQLEDQDKTSGRISDLPVDCTPHDGPHLAQSPHAMSTFNSVMFPLVSVYGSS